MARSEFSHRSIGGAPHGRRMLLLATVFVVCLFALDGVTHGSVRNAVRGVAARVWSGASSARSGVAQSGTFSSAGSLAHENAALRDQLALVQERAAAYETLKRENESLRAMLHLTQTSTGITAPVVSSYSASPYGTFIIGAGQNDGIAKNDLVLSDAGFVIGRVSDVGASRTVVKSIFVAGASVDVVLGNAAATAVGEGGGNARVSIPRGIDVQAGDSVISPTLGQRPVGVVGKVEQVTTTAEQKIYIVQPVNFQLLHYVYVVPAP